MREELVQYIQHARAEGVPDETIKQELFVAGWKKADVSDTFDLLGNTGRKQPPRKVRPEWFTKVVYAVLVGVILALAGAVYHLWNERIDLQQTNDERVQNFFKQLTQAEIAFDDAGRMVFPDEQKFISKKNEYIEAKRDFVVADLKEMKLTLYEKGNASTTYDIRTKGKEGSWWETPTGNYTVLGKNANAYSTIGNVWMPYSMQIYGNYLIHGWPYRSDGTPVPEGYSGGCIRLSTEDAEKVFNFVEVGTPVLVLEDSVRYDVGAPTPKVTPSIAPGVSAQSFVITNLSTGEVLLKKNEEDKHPLAGITKLMTAIVAHETIYLGRTIKVHEGMLAAAQESFSPTLGGEYVGLDLLYPLLMESSDRSANILARSVGEKIFIRNMNSKAKSLDMEQTAFIDPTGLAEENVSTATDVTKLLQYIYYKRPFIFDITKGVAFDAVGVIQLGDTVPVAGLRNQNEFIHDSGLVGVQNGSYGETGEVLASVWNIHTNGGDIPVSIVVLNSLDRKEDTEKLIAWVRNNYETKAE